jgi:hypothetical protein
MALTSMMVAVSHLNPVTALNSSPLVFTRV